MNKKESILSLEKLSVSIENQQIIKDLSLDMSVQRK